MELTTQRIISDREWILTNGMGGYSLGFGNFMNKRKYNGILIASSPDLRRYNILSSLEERVEKGTGFFFLDSSHYSNCIFPEGYRHILGSWLRPYPCVLYSSLPAHDEVAIFKEIFLLEGENAVVIKYTNFGTKHLSMVVRPKFALRDHHQVNARGVWDEDGTTIELGDGTFRIRRGDNGLTAFGYVKNGDLIQDRSIYRDVYYPMEAIRGYDSVEDLIAPVRITFDLEPGSASTLVFSTSSMEDVWSKARGAEERYKSLPLPADHPERVDVVVDRARYASRIQKFDLPSYRSILRMAAEDFIVNGDDVIAGYPWFGAWGRDTLISLEGLRNVDNAEEKIHGILKRYGGSIKSGMIPNTFGEGGEGLNYDSIDAPLWYVLRCFQFGKDDAGLFGHCCDIVISYLIGQEHPFYVADDGLIEITKDGGGLTWMDARIYGNPVTPRCGKPVEINALWYNALCAIKEMANEQGVENIVSGTNKRSIGEIGQLADQVRNSFAAFIGDEYIADRIVDGEKVFEIRPNAVTALSLPFDVVDSSVMKLVWETAKEKLLTAYGLRSLDPQHHGFKQKYIGNQKLRDLSYHQGTVWTYLLLPFVQLTLKVHRDSWTKDELSREIVRYVWAFRDAFCKGEMSSVAEIWDGLDPYFPKGCPAQAWSVFAIAEIERILDGLGEVV